MGLREARAAWCVEGGVVTRRRLSMLLVERAMSERPDESNTHKATTYRWTTVGVCRWVLDSTRSIKSCGQSGGEAGTRQSLGGRARDCQPAVVGCRHIVTALHGPRRSDNIFSVRNVTHGEPQMNIRWRRGMSTAGAQQVAVKATNGRGDSGGTQTSICQRACAATHTHASCAQSKGSCSGE